MSNYRDKIMTDKLPWMEPIINIHGIERLRLYPEWIKVGTVVVHRQSRLSAEIVGFTAANNPIVEFDDDGSMDEIDGVSLSDLVQYFEPWSPGMEVKDRTGKGRFANPSAWREWWDKISMSTSGEQAQTK